MKLAVALAALALHAPQPPGITVHAQACPADPVTSCAVLATREIYFDPADYDPRDTWGWMPELAHEVGHIWDSEHMTDAARARYAAFVGADPAAAWYGAYDQAFSAPTAPGEEFADAYALCAMGPRYRASWRAHWGDAGKGDYIAPEGYRMPRTVVAATCWLLHHPPR